MQLDDAKRSTSPGSCEGCRSRTDRGRAARRRNVIAFCRAGGDGCCSSPQGTARFRGTWTRLACPCTRIGRVLRGRRGARCDEVSDRHRAQGCRKGERWHLQTTRVTCVARLTREALESLQRLEAFLPDAALKHGDWELPDRAPLTIRSEFRILESSPFTCRNALDDRLERELVIPFGASGYVALFHIVGEREIVVSAIRHQREGRSVVHGVLAAGRGVLWGLCEGWGGLACEP